jgi:hypothetical protein
VKIHKMFTRVAVILCVVPVLCLFQSHTALAHGTPRMAPKDGLSLATLAPPMELASASQHVHYPHAFIGFLPNGDETLFDKRTKRPIPGVVCVQGAHNCVWTQGTSDKGQGGCTHNKTACPPGTCSNRGTHTACHVSNCSASNCSK